MPVLSCLSGFDLIVQNTSKMASEEEFDEEFEEEVRYTFQRFRELAYILSTLVPHRSRCYRYIGKPYE